MKETEYREHLKKMMKLVGMRVVAARSGISYVRLAHWSTNSRPEKSVSISDLIMISDAMRGYAKELLAEIPSATINTAGQLIIKAV